MKKLLAIALAATLFVSPAVAEEEKELDLGSKALLMCIDEHDPDWEMVSYCREKQDEAIAAFAKWANSKVRTDDETLSNLFDICSNEWTKSVRGVKVLDYVMLNYCINKQLEGYNDVHGSYVYEKIK